MAARDALSAHEIMNPGVAAEILLKRVHLRQIDVASSGQIAFAVAESCTRPNRPPKSRIWTVSVEKPARQVTRGPGIDALPCWSPTGSSFAFASDRDSPGRMSLYIQSCDIAEAVPIGELAGSVEDIHWSAAGDALLVLAAGHGTDSGSGHEPAVTGDADGLEADPRVVQVGQAWRRLFRVDVATGTSMEVGAIQGCVWEIDWHESGSVAAVLSSDASEGAWYGSHLGVIDPISRATRTLYQPKWQIACPRFSPDGDRVAFIEGLCSDRGDLVGTVTIVDRRSGESHSLAEDANVSWLQWRDESRLWFAGLQGMSSICGTISLDGDVEQIWTGEASLGAPPRIVASSDGRRLISAKDTVSQPAEISVLATTRRQDGWSPLTSLNADISEIEPQLCERLVWNASDGLEIDGLLVRPRNYDGERLPLIVVVHGGPTSSWMYRFPSGFGHAYLLAEAGYAILLPNPRGSSGRGQEFARANIGDLGGSELQDILAGVDACVRAGTVDDGRIGIMGASHGGFMAAWAVTQTNRFAASVALASVSDYLSLHYTSNIPELDDILFIGSDPIASYLERSPILHAHKCTTPTLILHGELDPYCPVSQAHEMHRALTDAGVETELVIYPREGHGWIERDHQIDVWRRVRRWFDSHLLKQEHA